MIHISLLTLSIFIPLSQASVVIDGFSYDSDPYATVSLTDDPRDINKINGNGYFKLFQDFGDPLYDW